MSGVKTATAPVWLVTGCSTGIGREIAHAALAAGARVVATARRPEAVQALVDAAPERCISAPLDVTDQAQIGAAVGLAESHFGRIDVLVNNAGYGYLAAVEEGEDADVRAMFDANFFGTVDLIKAVLPGMRAQRAGRIINISSMTGLVSNPGAVYYSASKFAMESLSEGLRKELEPFGIRVSAVEPGAVRTDWAGRSMHETRRPIADYEETVGARRKLIRSMDGRMAGDPRKVAEAVVMLSQLDEPPLHLLLGRDVYAAWTEKLAGLQRSAEQWRSVSEGIDFDEE